ncbi:MAG: hypothetical protein WCT12_06040 [Verrucomicrobiota bacterium]
MKEFKTLIFSRARSGAVCSILTLLAAGLLGPQLPTAAHGLLATYVQHGVRLKVGAEHIDLTLDLTFFEEPSARERTVMDADANGHITRSEVDAYLKKLAPEMLKQVKLSVAGHEVPLIPLYDPEIDLSSDQMIATAHHRLRLYFFAATPVGLGTDDEILIEDQLWPETKSLGTPQAEGSDGCTMLPEISIRSNAAAATVRESRRFKFRCVKPPIPKSAAAANAHSPRTLQPKPATP